MENWRRESFNSVIGLDTVFKMPLMITSWLTYTLGRALPQLVVIAQKRGAAAASSGDVPAAPARDAGRERFGVESSQKPEGEIQLPTGIWYTECLSPMKFAKISGSYGRSTLIELNVCYRLNTMIPKYLHTIGKFWALVYGLSPDQVAALKLASLNPRSFILH